MTTLSVSHKTRTQVSNRRSHVKIHMTVECLEFFNFQSFSAKFELNSGATCVCIRQMGTESCVSESTRWFKYDRDKCALFTHKSVPVIFEPPCISVFSNVVVCILWPSTLC